MRKGSIGIIVTGKVQDVWFRKYTCDKGIELELQGFVRNEVDGSVYAEATGSASALKKIEDWCWTGSPLTKVDSVRVVPIQETHEAAFHIQE